jgi:hypothetical protein
VLAGKPERKTYGLSLWRSGYAPALVLSVARFEWRGIDALGLPSDGGLRALVDQTPPERRHFFLILEGSRVRAEWVRRERFGTRSEARAFVRLADDRGWHDLLVITTAAHTRRTGQCLRRAFRDTRRRITTIPVPEALSSIRRDRWWADPRARRFVIREWIKLAIYQLLR